MLILGYHNDGVPNDLLEALASARIPRIANLGHSVARERALVASVPIDNLSAPFDELHERMSGGEWLVDWRAT